MSSVCVYWKSSVLKQRVFFLCNIYVMRYDTKGARPCSVVAIMGKTQALLSNIQRLAVRCRGTP